MESVWEKLGKINVPQMPEKGKFRLPNGHFCYGNVHPIFVPDEKKQALDVQRFDMVQSLYILPVSINSKLVQKYDMAPHQEIGRYIAKLTEVVKNKFNAMPPAQARQIMLITMASILYGVYEYGESIKRTSKNAKDAEAFLLEDVLHVKAGLGNALSELESGEDIGWNWERMNFMDRMGYSYVTDYGAVRAKTDSLQKFGADLSKYYQDCEGNASENFFKDFGRMLCRHVTRGYDSRKSISDIRYSGTKVHDIASLIQAVRNMGNEYMLAPAVNLYVDAIISCLFDNYYLHRGRVVYPRGKSSR